MPNRINVAIFATHPIQYHVPWFKALADREDINLKVYYGLLPTAEQQGVGFGVSFKWDVPLLEGYKWENLSGGQAEGSLSGFFGIKYKGLGKALARDQISVAIVTGWNSWCLIQALLVCKFRGIKTIVRGESNALRPRSTIKKLFHRLLLKRFDRYLVIGKGNKSFYRAVGISDRHMFDCPYFVDNEFFEQKSRMSKNERVNLRNSFGVSEDAIVILFAGKLEEKKHPEDVIDAIRVVAQRNSDTAIHLLIVGDGELKNKLEDTVTQNNLPVTFLGFVNQSRMPECYAISDCLVLPSDYGETWGLVVNEAMASGRPAIVSDRVGCAPDLISNGQTGYVFRFGKLEALVDLLVDLERNADRLPRMGEQARCRVKSNYSLDKAVEGVISAISEQSCA